MKFYYKKQTKKEKEWQLDTARIVKETEERMEKEASRRLTDQHLRDARAANIACEKALAEYKEKYIQNTTLHVLIYIYIYFM